MAQNTLSDFLAPVASRQGLAAGLEQFRQVSGTAAQAVQEAAQHAIATRTTIQQITAAAMQDSLHYFQKSWDCWLEHGVRMAQSGNPTEFMQCHSEAMKEQIKLVNRHMSAMVRAGQDISQGAMKTAGAAAERASETGQAIIAETEKAAENLQDMVQPYERRADADGGGRRRGDGLAPEA